VRPRRSRRSRFIVTASVPATKQIAALRGEKSDALEAAVADLSAEGCKQAGTRMLGRDGEWSRYCERRGYETQRIITTVILPGDSNDEFAALSDEERAVVLVLEVGNHDDEAFYRNLSRVYDISETGVRRGDQPACCGDDGWPSVGQIRSKRASAMG
jgi:hypothetical protein